MNQNNKEPTQEEVGKYNYLCGEFSAAVWAKAWMEVMAEKPEIAHDEDCMVAWFANAIMAGYDHAHQELAKKDREKAFLCKGL